MDSRIILLRIVHGLFAAYFIGCIVYIYYAAIVQRFDLLLIIAIGSLALEGLVVFILNKGDCPLIFIQRKIGDKTPFFNLFLPEKAAKLAVPFFTGVAFVGLFLVFLRWLLR